MHGVLCGWFDHWGAGPRRAGRAAEATDALREILGAVRRSICTWRTGDEFRGWAGANRGGGALHDGPLEPDVTSYDYDAPIDEFGRPTGEVLAVPGGAGPLRAEPVPDVRGRPRLLGAPVEAELTSFTPLDGVLAALGGPESESATPPSFEALDVGPWSGAVRGDGAGTAAGVIPLRAAGLRGHRRGVRRRGAGRCAHGGGSRSSRSRWRAARAWSCVGGVAGPGQLRAAYREPKGITGGLLHERQFLHGVRARGLRLDAFVPERAAALRFGGAGRGACGPCTVRSRWPRRGDAALGLPGLGAGVSLCERVLSGPLLVGGSAGGVVRAGSRAAGGDERVWVLETDRAAPSRGAVRWRRALRGRGWRRGRSRVAGPAPRVVRWVSRVGHGETGR